jgi:nitrate reductase NapAB chaperone NapD
MEKKKDEEINEKLGEIQRLEGIIEVPAAPHALMCA